MFKAFLFVALIMAANTTLADAIQTYNYEAYGDVGTKAGVPVGNFSFDGARLAVGDYQYYNGEPQFTAPGSFVLGQFTARALPADSSLTYTNLPFYIWMDVSPVGENAMPGGEIRITGLLNGTASGSGSSTVIASIQSITSSGPLPFPLADFKIDAPQALNGVGKTTLTARIEAPPQPVPEPSTLATILVGLALASLRRKRSRPQACNEAKRECARLKGSGVELFRLSRPVEVGPMVMVSLDLANPL